MSGFTHSRLLVAVALVSAALVGCEALQPRTADEMASEVTRSTVVGARPTLAVLPVSGGKKTERSFFVDKPPTVEDERLQALLVASLAKSGLFAKVSIDAASDYALSAEIAFQDITFPSSTNTLMLLVHYELVDRKDGRIAWKDNIYTQRELSGNGTFVGPNASQRLLEQGLIEQMNTLVVRLEAHFAQ